MSHLEKTVHKARSRLTLDRWLHCLAFGVTVGAASFAAITLAARLFAWSIPLGPLAIVLLAAVVIVSTIWTFATRADMPTAAAALDEAAGLRERLSSGLYCETGDDPFVQAVRTDAENTSRSVTPRQHLQLHWPNKMGSAVVASLFAAAMLLVPSGVLVGDEQTPEEQTIQVKRTAAIIKKRTEHIKRAPTNADLKKIADDLDKIGEVPEGKLRTPAELRRQALRKLDELQDALRKQQSGDKFENAKAFKKMLRGLKPNPNDDSEASKLAKALATGDFKAAQQQVKQLQKKLAEMKASGNAKNNEALQKQLDELAKKLETLSESQKLKDKLTQAGLKKEDVERMLKNLTKEDIENVRKQLQQQGLNQKEVSEMMKQLQQQAGASQMAQQMAKALQQAANAAGAGQMGQASQSMGQAAGMMSEMEMLEQELNDMSSMMSDMQSARNDLSNSCSQCNGTGQNAGGQCGSCNGSGMGQMAGQGGMGPNPGQGRGGIAQEQATADAFVKRRQKVHTGQGVIIGQRLVDGEQHKGEVSPALKEIVVAAENDATDAIDRKRIPRRYHKAVKEYFSDVNEVLGEAVKQPDEAKDGEETAPPESSTDDK